MLSKLILFMRNPKVRIFGILFIVWLAGVWHEKTWQFAVYPFISCTVFALFDIIYTNFKTKKIYFPFSSLISGILIGLLIHPSQGLYTLALAILLACISKQFIKLDNRHIFNPAAFGIVASSILTKTPVSWWAVSSGGISIILIPLLASYTLYKLKKLQYPVSFIIGYFVFLLFLRGLQPAIALIMDGTVFLFSFIMLPEPMTSPVSGWWHNSFGLIVLIFLVTMSVFSFISTDPLLTPLLLANVLWRIFSR